MKQFIAHLNPSIHPLREKIHRMFADINAEILAKECVTEQDIIDFAADAVAIFVAPAPITKHVIKHLRKCKTIGCASTGTDNVDHEAATENNIVVTYVPAFCTNEVSTHVLMFILACSRKLLKVHEYVKLGRWDHKRFDAVGPITGLEKQTLGLIGFGQIGQAVARKVRPLDIEIVAHDPYIDNNIFRELDVQPSDFDQLLQKSDYVALTLPLTKETEDLISEPQLRMMKPNAFLINVSRGGVVDENALIEALKQKVIAGAALDCLAQEPPDKNNPLFKLDNVIFTPHTAGYTNESMNFLREKTASQIIDVLSGYMPEHIRNPEVLNTVKLSHKDR